MGKGSEEEIRGRGEVAGGDAFLGRGGSQRELHKEEAIRRETVRGGNSSHFLLSTKGEE